ncbi:MAG: GFA family protein [bacterium]|nr:GFA family protein [bacterium]
MSESATVTVAGSCSCGAVRFDVRSPSKFCAHCHCDNCRRAHGAAFVTYAGYPADQVRVTAGRDSLVRYRTDTDATRSFCGTCGSTLFYEGPRWPDEIHVARANIDGEIDRLPDAHAYVDHAADWWTIADELSQFGGDSGVEPKVPER